MKNKKIIKDIKKFILGKREFNYLESSNEMLYPIDLEFTLQDENFYYTPKDNQGLPQRYYESVGLTYNPTRMASFTLAHWNRYKIDENKLSLKKFNKALEWFINYHEEGVWYYDFDWNELQAPWLSGMAQGQIISVLTRAYQLTNNPLYKKISLKAIIPFEKKIELGGVVSHLGNDIFFEEYPTNNPKHVLNGYLFSMIGIIDLLSIMKKTDKDYERVKELSENAFKSLEKNIERWDNGYWSVYDLENEKNKIQNTCTISYHSLQIAQLTFIGKEFKSEKIIKVAKRWDGYAKSLYKRLKSLLMKIIYRYKNPAQR